VCAGDKESYEDEDHVSITSSIDLLRCRGCGEWSIRRLIVRQAPDQPQELAEPKVSIDPPRTWRRPPEWLDQLEAMDPGLTALLREVYLCANDRQPWLLSMGVRAILDLVMIQIVGDTGSFESKMAAMAEQGHISIRQQDMLATVIDAGSAASHRGFQPPRDLLEQMLAVMESIVRDHFITNPMLGSLKKQIPPRPPRRMPKQR
jgi:hypothetical protein